MKKLIAVFVALLLMAILAVGVSAQTGPQGYFDVESNLRVWQDSIFRGDITANDDVTVTDQLAVGNDITVSDDAFINDALVAGKVRYTKGTTQTVTFDTLIASTYTYQPISSAGAVGTGGIVTSTAVAGNLLILENVANQTITISDTGTTMLTGNVSLGQYDTLALIFDGTNWVMLYTSNN